MQYESPEITRISPAIEAIRGGAAGKPKGSVLESTFFNEPSAAYADWE